MHKPVIANFDNKILRKGAKSLVYTDTAVVGHDCIINEYSRKAAESRGSSGYVKLIALAEKGNTSRYRV